MAKVRVRVVWGSGVGRFAEAVARGAEKAGAEVRVSEVREAGPADVVWADAVIFGWPGGDVARLEQFVGTLDRRVLADKVCSGFVASQSEQPEVLRPLFHAAYHQGGIVVPQVDRVVRVAAAFKQGV